MVTIAYDLIEFQVLMIEKIKKSSEILRVISEVDSWFLANEDRLGQMMEDYRLKWSAVKGEDSYGVLDPQRRLLSEMPICWSLQGIDKYLPLEGFEFVSPNRGWVLADEKLTGHGFSWSTNHGYLLNPKKDVVVCLTFGQFVSVDPNSARGERVLMVEQMAPQLVVRGSNLAILRGKHDEIRDGLGLDYTQRKKKN